MRIIGAILSAAAGLGLMGLGVVRLFSANTSMANSMYASIQILLGLGLLCFAGAILKPSK